MNHHLLVNKHLGKNNHLVQNGANPCKPVQSYFPLQFWFNRYTNLALPLVALQFHDVKIQFIFRSLDHLINTDGTSIGTNTSIPETKLFVDFIFLDVDERKKFEEIDNFCEECKKEDESVSQNLILIGFKICNSCKTSKTLFPI